MMLPKEKELRQIIGEAVGHGSMCWNPRPSNQVFDSAEGEKATEDALNKIRKLVNFQLVEAKENMSFGQAVIAAKQGFKVAREGWNGKNMYAVIMPGYPDGIEANEATQKAHGIPMGTKLVYRPYWQLYTAQKDVAMWAPSGSDSLADDWCIVP